MLTRGYRYASLLMVCILVLLLIAGCGNNNVTSNNSTESIKTDATAVEKSAEPVRQEKVVVNYWNGFGGSDRPVLESIVKKFNQSQNEAEVKMEIMAWDVLYQKLTASAASGQGPDMIAFGPENVATYVDLGVVAPINDFYENKMIDISLLPRGYDQLLQYKGNYVGVPMNFYNLAFFYNKDLAKKVGLDPEAPPKNWDEIADWAVKITDVKKGVCGLSLPTAGDIFPMLMWQNGGDIINYTDKTSTINQPKAVGAVKFWTDLMIKNSIAAPQDQDFVQLFASQKLGMMFSGPWAIATLKAAKVNYGLTMMPPGPEKQVTMGTGLLMLMTKQGTAKKDAVYKYLQYWFSQDSQKEWAAGVGFPPVRTDLSSDPGLISANPDMKVFMDSASIAQPWLVGIVNSNKIINDVNKKAFDEIILNKADVQKTLDKAAAEMDKILATER